MIKNSILYIMFIFCSLLSRAQTVAIADGFAEDTTGGGNATPITVTTAADFERAATSSLPAFIIVSGNLNIGQIIVQSNKTIIGANSCAFIVTVSWCRFRYINQNTHNFANLIGHCDANGAQDIGKLHMTMHHGTIQVPMKLSLNISSNNKQPIFKSHII